MEGDVIYEKNDVREAWNRKVENQINQAEKKCTPFPISCQQRDGVWGIWLQAGDEFLLVDPIELTNSVFVDDMYCMLGYYNKEFDGKKPRGFFYVKTRCDNHNYQWSLSHTILDFSGLRLFTFEEYLGKTKTAIGMLYEVWSKQEPVAYDGKSSVGLDGVELCKKQLGIKAVLPSNYVLKNELVQEEDFRFYPVKDEYFKDLVIGIGNREYKTCLSDWENDLERIRHQLESYVFEGETTLKLFYDTSETTVILKKKSVLDHIEESLGGCLYKYKDYVLVEVRPNEFVGKPVLKGYCDEKATVRTLYEGLLKHAMRFPLEAEESCFLPDMLAGYNMVKSPIIEAFLVEKKESYPLLYAVRQVHVKHILTIERQKESWPKVIDLATGQPYGNDWEGYHERELELAKQLKEELSTEYDLWYQAPFEDEGGTVPKHQLII